MSPPVARTPEADAAVLRGTYILALGFKSRFISLQGAFMALSQHLLCVSQGCAVADEQCTGFLSTSLSYIL